MMFDPFMMGAELAMAEELGLLDTRESELHRVAEELRAYYTEPISEEELEEACEDCGVDFDTLSYDEIEKILEYME